MTIIDVEQKKLGSNYELEITLPKGASINSLLLEGIVIRSELSECGTKYLQIIKLISSAETDQLILKAVVDFLKLDKVITGSLVHKKIGVKLDQFDFDTIKNKILDDINDIDKSLAKIRFATVKTKNNFLH